MMKITIIYDNTSISPGLIADWGFSCLVEAGGEKLLFDTGGDGHILLSNMKELGIKPQEINKVFISHNHFDHTGGLSAFLHENNQVTVYAPPSFRGVKRAKKLVYIDKAGKLDNRFFTTGELENVEQSLVVDTPKGLVVVAGCSHPKMKTIMEAAGQFGTVYGIVGGLHGFDDYELFKELQLICPTHCTQHKAEIQSLYPGKYMEGGAGTILSIE